MYTDGIRVRQALRPARTKSGDTANVRFVLYAAQPEFHRGDEAIPDGNADCPALRIRYHRCGSWPFRDHPAVSPRALFSRGVFQAGPIGTLADMAAACAGATM